MRKLFIQFYLLLMASFLLVTLLVGGIYKLTAERSSEKSLTDLMDSVMTLLERELAEVPQENWPQQLASLDLDLSFPVHIEYTQDQPLDDDSFAALGRGEIVILEDRSLCMEQIPDTNYVLVAGPIPYLSFQHEIADFDYLLLGLLGISLGLPVFIWIRPHWRDLLLLERTARRLGRGDLSARINLPEKSSLQRLGRAFDQMADNIQWIKGAQENKLVVGSQARILYADAEGRIKIAEAFNQAIARGEIGYVILGRDHHDVSGTDSPYRETSNIYDGSRFTADMAIQNVIGDSFRGATWVSIHNGGGVGWGEVINGGFGMVLDGTKEASRRLESMLFWDVNNGISRRSWARNEGAIFAIKRAMETQPLLKVTIPNIVDDSLL